MNSEIHRIIIAGIGPGVREYILPAAQAAIDRAAVLVGGRRALAEYAQPADSGQLTQVIDRDIDGVLAFIDRQLAAHDVSVMVSGDPGYYSLLDALRRRFPANLLRVIPGISSFQLAFARLALPWHDARLLSFHGRYPREEDLQYAPGAMLGMLNDTTYDSARVAQVLLEHGWPGDSRFFICSRLSYPDEEIITAALQQAASGEIPGRGNCVLIVAASQPE